MSTDSVGKEQLCNIQPLIGLGIELGDLVSLSEVFPTEKSAPLHKYLVLPYIIYVAKPKIC